MLNTVFPEAARAVLAEAYPARAAKLPHGLSAHPLLTLDALADLAGFLPPEEVEYNPGDLPVGIAPEDVPQARMGVQETIRDIAAAGSWVALKRIERHPGYAELLGQALAEIESLVAPMTGRMLGREGFIFISSPNAVTPFHFDPEHNILLQIAGRKTMTVFQTMDEALFPPDVHEDFHVGAHHRNLDWRDSYASRGTAIAIGPGEAIHVPVKAPHWVHNGPEPSISLSVTWRSEWSYAEADARAFNHAVRRLGMEPKSPAPWPARNMPKALAWRAIRKMKSGLAG
ncbi:MAG: cupin-like domain-containing protein [Novosphingobium sp.]|nr:cupin-like domain-containing protein [Novosphingobium sp.]